MALRSDASRESCEHLSLDLGANAAEVRAALADVSEALCRGGLGRDLRGTVELVLAEALNNVVEHAHAGCEAGRIGIKMQRAGDRVLIELRDRGHPMPGLTLPKGRLKPLGGGGDVPEGGFGWYLIRRLAAEVRYRREAGENILHIAIHA